MKKVSMKLNHCYGIKKLEYTFDFSKKSNYILYASNGMMKTSFTKTLKAVASKKKPTDEVFERRTVCDIQVDGIAISPEQVFVINSYEDEYISPNSAKLMVQKDLRAEYDIAMQEINTARNSLYESLIGHLGGNINIEKVLSDFLCCQPVDILDTLSKEVNANLLNESYFEVDFCRFRYEDICSDAVAVFLQDPKNQESLKEYSERYNELLSCSPIFRRGVFSHNNANNISESLCENGFFDANHILILNGIAKEIQTATDLADIIKSEREKIFSDEKLKKKFEKINTALGKRALKEFRRFVEYYPESIIFMADFDLFKRMIWVSLLKKTEAEVLSTIEKYKESQEIIKKIKERSVQERTQWDRVLEIFKSRFSVPFTIEVPNQEDVCLLGNMPEFIFKYIDIDSEEEIDVPRKNLEKVLSQGEKRALFLLNIINDLEALKLSSEPYLVIADDIAESFDYKNKYAIIEYLYEMMSDSNLHFIVLTHNFDFYRTVASRATGIIQPLMVQRVPNGLEIVMPKYVFKNPFEEIRKGIIANKDKDIITSIPFVRNIIEYTKGSTNNTNYLTLTSLLHIKEQTKQITIQELQNIYNEELSIEPALSFANTRENDKVYNIIINLARIEAQGRKETIELDGKIIISMATRLLAEEFMITKLAQNGIDIQNFSNHQTGSLLQKYKDEFPNDTENIKMLNKVLLMSSENIHINSFMFEPLIDISIKSLIDLFGRICIMQPPTNVIR